jgi:hypothetical protein
VVEGEQDPVASARTAPLTATVAPAVGDGEIAHPGAWMPEQVVDPARFFQRLASAGLRVDV